MAGLITNNRLGDTIGSGSKEGGALCSHSCRPSRVRLAALMCCALLLFVIGMVRVGYRRLVGKTAIEVTPWPPSAYRTYGENLGVAAPCARKAISGCGDGLRRTEAVRWRTAFGYAAVCGISYEILTVALLPTTNPSRFFGAPLCLSATRSISWPGNFEPHIATLLHFAALMALSVAAGLFVRSRVFQPFETHPVPLAMVAAGGAWLLMSLMDQPVFYRFVSVETAEPAYGRLRLVSASLMVAGAMFLHLRRNAAARTAIARASSGS